jgi:enamine deaminase RidA (YjgF/YER057c/UK114 family)
MPDVTRRALIGASTYTAIALAAPAAAAQGAPAPAGKSRTSRAIQRFGPAPVHSGVPRINFGVVHGDIVYLSGMTAVTVPPATKAPPPPAGGLGDVADQTRRVCAGIDQLLATAGTSKINLLTAQVWLTDMKNFPAHNDAWNEWIDPSNAPTRVCVLSPQLFLPGLLVEIMVTAAK